MKKCWSEMYQFELTDPVGKHTIGSTDFINQTTKTRNPK